MNLYSLILVRQLQPRVKFSGIFDRIRPTDHALEEMRTEGITEGEVERAINNPQRVEHQEKNKQRFHANGVTVVTGFDDEAPYYGDEVIITAFRAKNH